MEQPTPGEARLVTFAGAIADRYKIERQIGRGGMATVYLARDIKHDRAVAVKVLDPQLGAVLGVDRFLAEIKVTANLQHPNLLPLFDSGEADGQLFYVMPFVDGESLRARLNREKQLSVDAALRIAVAVANALQYAHERGVIHRDLKPENILLQAGQPVVADFGIALAVSNAAGERITQSGISLGTPQYMSPEQAAGDRQLDERSDIYSLGAVVYEMLAGDPPHTGSTVQAIVAKVLTERPQSIALTRHTVPQHVSAAIECALEKIPSDRWEKARDFAEALEGRAVRTPGRGTTLASASVKAVQVHSWRARMRDPLTLMLATIALAATGFGVSNMSSRESADRVVRFPLALEQNERLVANGVPFAVAGDGNIIVYAARRDSARSRLYLRRLDDQQSHAIPGTEGATNPFASPDGKWIGFLVGPKMLKVSLGDGKVVPIADVENILGASWGSDDLIAFSRDGLLVVPASGGPVRRITSPDTAAGEGRQWYPLLLNDGKTILYSSYDPKYSYRIAAADVATGKATIFDLPGVRPLGIIDGRLLYANGGGNLMAVPFDSRGVRITGSPEPVLDHVAGGATQVRAALSASGTLVFLAGETTYEVVMVEPGGAERRITTEARSYAFPRFSPDEKSIALTVRSAAGKSADIWIYDVGSKAMAPLTSGDVNDRPEWTPDGKQVLIRSTRGGESALWLQPVDRRAPATRLLSAPTHDIFEAVMSGDGEHLVFRTGSSATQAAWVQALHGNAAPKRFDGEAPRFSPDGHWLAFVSSRTGRTEIFVSPYPALDSMYQVSFDGGNLPVWSRGGRLHYMHGTRIVATTLTLSPKFSVANRDTLFDGRYYLELGHAAYDVSADGKRFLFVKPAGSEPEPIVVVNWREELRARLKGTSR